MKVDRESARDTGQTVEALERLRAKLGDIDAALLEQLKRRVDCCIEIARVKKAHNLPMMQPHRIGIVHERAARFARERGVDPDFVRRVYDTIIEETCRIEDQAMGNATGDIAR